MAELKKGTNNLTKYRKYPFRKLEILWLGPTFFVGIILLRI
jgi:hypothetical protein